VQWKLQRQEADGRIIVDVFWFGRSKRVKHAKQVDPRVEMDFEAAASAVVRGKKRPDVAS